ncbi:MAG: hypothetical protein H6834_06395 [Planctomycetes bacterium]|nr:hypothetical protein [Planctomycetota bacterium]
MRPLVLSSLLIGLGLASVTHAAEILVTSDIAVSTTWTSNNTYNLQNQIYVLPGATLTIEAGTVIASDTGLGGSLAVARGAQIFVLGVQENPVVFTSKADVATWAADPSHPTGGDPRTGTWREGANEWGNLTIMGNGYISENATVGNTPVPNANNVGAMEGLIASFPGDPKVLYGGGDDDDDSGTIQFASFRYGGRVIGLNNELNGLSLGGIGRGTDIHHVEIMNNVDDGIEIWGGTVNLKYLSIWNIGDDSLDIDQGWRGKAQFGLIVQGYSLNASQGSGVGDNAIEMDGAEDSDWQPVTSASIYNFTVIGQPLDGDGLTAWRDNARVQFRNCIFMDGGEAVVRFDNVDGDGANGYGHNGTLSWAQTWSTNYNVFSTVNAPANPSVFYQTQVDGKLAEIKDSICYNNVASSAYTEFNNVGANAPANNNVIEPASSPIVSITRGAPVLKGGKAMVPVTALDPRPAADALTSVGTAPADGFFTRANYRGAFAPGCDWLCGWTATSAYGITPNGCNGTFVTTTTGCGAATLVASGFPNIGGRVNYSVTNTAGLAQLIWIGTNSFAIPLCAGCNLGTDQTVLLSLPAITGDIPCFPGLVGASYYVQGADVIGTTGGCSLGGGVDFTLTETVQTVIGG